MYTKVNNVISNLPSANICQKNMLMGFQKLTLCPSPIICVHKCKKEMYILLDKKKRLIYHDTNLKSAASEDSIDPVLYHNSHPIPAVYCCVFLYTWHVANKSTNTLEAEHDMGAGAVARLLLSSNTGRLDTRHRKSISQANLRPVLTQPCSFPFTLFPHLPPHLPSLHF